MVLFTAIIYIYIYIYIINYVGYMIWNNKHGYVAV